MNNNAQGVLITGIIVFSILTLFVSLIYTLHLNEERDDDARDYAMANGFQQYISWSGEESRVLWQKVD